MTNPYSKFLSCEDTHHVEVVNYLKANYPNIIAFHVPNEGKKSSFERYKSSIMGCVKGISDFVIAYPKYKKCIVGGKEYVELDYHALFLELKAPQHNRIVKKGKLAGKTVKAIGKASPEQIAITEKLNKLRYKAVIVFGAEEAIKVINEYLSK